MHSTQYPASAEEQEEEEREDGDDPALGTGGIND
jgi:hypothetical protein